MSRRMLIAGNWKMNGRLADLDYFQRLPELVGECEAEILVCPPFPLLSAALGILEPGKLVIGAQDCHANRAGAHTGDVSAGLLAEMGVTHVIVGHSERRTDHGETDELVCAKAKAVQAEGLFPIICVGENLEERQAGRAVEVVEGQLAGSIPDTGDFIIAYEPVWAIGTGLSAGLDDIAHMHEQIRSRLSEGERRQILYGGSVKPGNCQPILKLADVDGALVGGASLEAESFAEIIKNAMT